MIVRPHVRQQLAFVVKQRAAALHAAPIPLYYTSPRESEPIRLRDGLERGVADTAELGGVSAARGAHGTPLSLLHAALRVLDQRRCPHARLVFPALPRGIRLAARLAAMPGGSGIARRPGIARLRAGPARGVHFHEHGAALVDVALAGPRQNRFVLALVPRRRLAPPALRQRELQQTRRPAAPHQHPRLAARFLQRLALQQLPRGTLAPQQRLRRQFRGERRRALRQRGVVEQQ